jgi:CRISPR-associated exonuclease Cas4
LPIIGQGALSHFHNCIGTSLGQPFDSGGGDVDDELDVVLISALEHWSYCPRQCGLIHLEAVWDENLYTLRGRHAHERADEPGEAIEDGMRVVRGMPLWHDGLGLYGKADVVEFHRSEASGAGDRGEVPYPVEYKAGERRSWMHEAIQLCAQALCLEAMLGVPVPAGAIYYRASRRRREVAIDADLRARTEAAIRDVRAMLAAARLPPAVNDPRCPNCSLIESCLPAVVSNAHRLGAFRSLLYRPLDGTVGELASGASSDED